MDFEQYYLEIKLKFDKLNYNYIGINRKEYPKWAGWKIINNYKEQNIDVKDIVDEQLETLVKNFYYLKFLDQFFK